MPGISEKTDRGDHQGEIELPVGVWQGLGDTGADIHALGRRQLAHRHGWLDPFADAKWNRKPANPHIRKFHTELYGHYARIGKALASPVRVEILDVLAQGPRTVEILSREVGGTVANVSRHLQILLSARLVTGSRRGLFVRYGLAGEEVADFLPRFRELARLRLAEIDQVARTFLGTANTKDVEPVDGGELLRRVNAGEVTVFDVRPYEEYEAGHLPGAISMPLDELRERLLKLPKDQEIVAYCRGPHCVLAVEAVGWLRKNGYRAERLELGVRDWQQRGFVIETGTGKGKFA